MKKILFVEDLVKAHYIIKEVFSNYKITIVADYESILREEPENYDVVVVDMFFPEKKGTKKKNYAKALRDLLWGIVLVRQAEDEIFEISQYQKLVTSGDLKKIQDCDRKIIKQYEGKSKLSKWDELTIECAKDSLRPLSDKIKKLKNNYNRTYTGIETWFSGHANDIPHGILLIKQYLLSDVRFHIASSLWHHNHKFEAIHQWLQFNQLYGYLHEPENRKTKNAKTTKEFWLGLLKKIEA